MSKRTKKNKEEREENGVSEERLGIEEFVAAIQRPEEEKIAKAVECIYKVLGDNKE